MKLKWRMNLNGDIQIEDVNEDAPLITVSLHNDLLKLNFKQREEFANHILKIVINAIANL